MGSCTMSNSSTAGLTPATFMRLKGTSQAVDRRNTMPAEASARRVVVDEPANDSARYGIVMIAPAAMILPTIVTNPSSPEGPSPLMVLPMTNTMTGPTVTTDMATATADALAS